MGKILIPGSSGGVSSDDVTAAKSHVLQGYKTVTTDSNDEVVEGEIVSRGTFVTASEVVNATFESTVHTRFEEGYYNKDGQYKPTAKIPYAVLTSVLGIDANKMLSDSTVAGVRGTIPIRGYHGPDSTEMWFYPQEGGYVVRIEEGYYHKSGDGLWKPYIIAPTALVKSAVNYHPEKTLSDTNTCQEQGTVKMINTQDSNYRLNKSTAFGIDGWSDRTNPVFWIDFPHGNGYYHRSDNHPHTCIDATALGTADANSVLQWQTATSVHGVKFEGAIQRWICTTGDVITALGGEGFAWDDTHANRGRGIVAKIPNNYYIQGANWVFLSSPNLYPQNVRAGVNINGVVGTMPDYSTGRTVFNGATFDGILATGVATKGFYTNGVHYAYNIQSGYGYSGIYDGGINLQVTTAYPALRSRRIGCVLSQSINVTPFRQIVIYYRSIATIQGAPYVSLEAHVSRASVRGQANVSGAIVDTIDVIKQGNASPAINREGQIILDVSTINDYVFLSFAAYCNQDRASDVFAGAVQITRIDFIN